MLLPLYLADALDRCTGHCILDFFLETALGFLRSSSSDWIDSAARGDDLYGLDPEHSVRFHCVRRRGDRHRQDEEIYLVLQSVSLFKFSVY